MKNVKVICIAALWFIAGWTAHRGATFSVLGGLDLYDTIPVRDIKKLIA